MGQLTLRLVAAAIGLTAALPAGAAPAPLQVPPIMMPPSSEHHTGKPVFMELITPDLASAKAFYAGMFGWTFRDVTTGRVAYAQAYLGDDAVAGMVERRLGSAEHRQPAWLDFFAVADVDSAVRTAMGDGAKALIPAHDLAGRGREAIMADPQGAVFALLASSSGDPLDELSPQGDWIWHALITTDPVADADFYRSVFGYQIVPLPSSPGERHMLLVSEDYARASANSLPADRPNAHPAWIGFVRVDDVPAAVAKANALGGQTLVEPRADRHGGQIAVVADPNGAPFGLMEWPEQQTPGSAP